VSLNGDFARTNFILFCFSISDLFLPFCSTQKQEAPNRISVLSRVQQVLNDTFKLFSTDMKPILSVKTMTVRMIKLNPDFLMQTLQGKAETSISNLPSDVELLDIKYDLFSMEVSAIVRSDSFEDVADAYPIPEFKLVYTGSAKKVSVEAQPAKSAVTKPKPVPVAKPVEKPRVQANQDVKAVEEEFSPEQRELLSFTLDGDYVVVKPIEYLKA
jgi:hypothetical protein